MTAARCLAALLAADVGCASIGRAGPKTAPTAASLRSGRCGLTQGAWETPLAVLFGLTLSGRWSRAIEWRGWVESKCGAVTLG